MFCFHPTGCLSHLGRTVRGRSTEPQLVSWQALFRSALPGFCSARFMGLRGNSGTKDWPDPRPTRRFHNYSGNTPSAPIHYRNATKRANAKAPQKKQTTCLSYFLACSFGIARVCALPNAERPNTPHPPPPASQNNQQPPPPRQPDGFEQAGAKDPRRICSLATKDMPMFRFDHDDANTIAAYIRSIRADESLTTYSSQVSPRLASNQQDPC